MTGLMSGNASLNVASSLRHVCERNAVVVLLSRVSTPSSVPELMNGWRSKGRRGRL